MKDSRFEKNLLIAASAGSGKTHQLSHRLIRLIANGAAPSSLIALTFTRKAAAEFATALIEKLLRATRDPQHARHLATDLDLPLDTDFSAILQHVLTELPRLWLGTIDSFFARVVRHFPLELGLHTSTFELLDPTTYAQREQRELTQFLSHILSQPTAPPLLSALWAHYRQQQHTTSRRFAIFDHFQQTFQTLNKLLISPTAHQPWGLGPHAPAFAQAQQRWEHRAPDLLTTLNAHLEEKKGVNGTPSGLEAYRRTLAELTDFLHPSEGQKFPHSTLSKRLADELLSPPPGPLTLPYGRSPKGLELSQEHHHILRELITLFAAAELEMSHQHSQNLQTLGQLHHREVRLALRRRGQLTFDDLRELMAAGQRDESARLARELIDYRLGERYAHWHLDEFQDTSPLEFLGLESLLSEALSDPEQSLFVVGDLKQSIYGFKGGDSRVFAHLRDHYRPTTLSMPRTYRCAPPLIELVNEVFSRLTTLESPPLLDAESRQLWPWETHESAHPQRPGHALVEALPPDAIQERVIESLHALQPQQRGLSVAVLVRSGSEVLAWANALRAAGFQVTDSGSTSSASANFGACAATHLLAWLAQPSCPFSRALVDFSPPLRTHLQRTFGPHPLTQWEGLTRQLAQDGPVAFWQNLITALRPALTPHGLAQMQALLTPLRQLSPNQDHSAATLYELLIESRQPSPQDPHRIQVMTAHKSKGLSFDHVILPAISTTTLTQSNTLRALQDPEFLLPEIPRKWTWPYFDFLKEPLRQAQQEQIRDEICLLYVMLTRSRHGLHLLLSNRIFSSKSPPETPSLAHLLGSVLDLHPERAQREWGQPNWMEHFPPQEPPLAPLPPRPLPPATPRPSRHQPSASHPQSSAPLHLRAGGQQFGQAVHQAFERIEWYDGHLPPASPAVTRLLEKTFSAPPIRELFTPRPRTRILREVPIETLTPQGWTSGIIDRLALTLDEQGQTCALHLIDFKTDALDNPALFAERYRDQMEAYRQSLALTHPGLPLRLTLLSTHLGQLIEL